MGIWFYGLIILSFLVIALLASLFYYNKSVKDHKEKMEKIVIGVASAAASLLVLFLASMTDVFSRLGINLPFGLALILPPLGMALVVSFLYCLLSKSAPAEIAKRIVIGVVCAVASPLVTFSSLQMYPILIPFLIVALIACLFYFFTSDEDKKHRVRKILFGTSYAVAGLIAFSMCLSLMLMNM